MILPSGKGYPIKRVLFREEYYYTHQIKSHTIFAIFFFCNTINFISQYNPYRLTFICLLAYKYKNNKSICNKKQRIYH